MVMAKYDPLAKFLEDSPRTEGTAILSFTQIEDVTGKALSMSARRHRSWWGNDSYHVQAVAWRAAGWRVFKVDLARQVVTFIRAS
jgi:hypothetical protein